MPNIWTHVLFAQEMIAKLGHLPILNDKRLKQVLNLGSQGPDFLFYHHFLPWQRDKTLPKLGSAMHTEQCGPFLLELMKRVQGRELYNPAVVYVLGFITHHILDRNMHPYVFYKSGFAKWKHQRFEIIMDTIIVRNKLGLETWKTPVWKQIDVGRSLPLGVADALRQTASRMYPALASDLSEDSWNEAYLDMLRAQRLFHDPSGIKRLLTFGQISPLVYHKRPAPLDYMNEAHTVWNCPTSMEETYTHSVWDLWDIAMADGLAVMSSALKVLQDRRSAEQTDYSAFQQLLGNRSYETGKCCGAGLEIVHVNPII